MCKTVQSSGPRVPPGDDKCSECERTYRRISRSGTRWSGDWDGFRLPLPKRALSTISAKIDLCGRVGGHRWGSLPLQQFTETYDVVVVGAGHAGCEAAMAAARMGLKTALYTLNVDLIAQMSCNPAVGGIAKGHLVREVDALGGIMGEVTDAVGIQFRLLNTSRGPAMWSPRAQCDKQQYRLKMRELLESEPYLHIKQAEVAELIVEEVSSFEFRVSSKTGQQVATGNEQLETGNSKLETSSIVRGVKLSLIHISEPT